MHQSTQSPPDPEPGGRPIEAQETVPPDKLYQAEYAHVKHSHDSRASILGDPNVSVCTETMGENSFARKSGTDLFIPPRQYCLYLRHSIAVC